MKIRLMLSAALTATLAGVYAQAADVPLKVVKSTRVETPGNKSGNVINATPIYSNITTFLGSGLVFGGAQAGQSQPAGGTGLLSAMGCDDASLQPGDPNGSYTLSEITFLAMNYDMVAIKAAPTVLFYPGPPGDPTTLIDRVTLGPVTLPPGVVSQVSADVSALGIELPLDANGEATIWVCEMFDDANGTAVDQNGAPFTQGQYSSLGVGLCDPPTLGSSLDNMFVTYAPVTAPFHDPVGVQGSFGGNPVANACFELSQ